MPWGLKRYQQARCLHFITFSCYRREPLLATPRARDTFEAELERVRRWYGFFVSGYVVMPEHVGAGPPFPVKVILSVAPPLSLPGLERQGGNFPSSITDTCPIRRNFTLWAGAPPA